MEFYTNVQVFRDNILYRGVKDGKKIRKKINFRPCLYYPSDEGTFKTIRNESLKEIGFSSISAAKEYSKNNDISLFGNSNFEYDFITRSYPNDIEWSYKDISIANIDIEVASDNGFPIVEKADSEIVAITWKQDGKIVILGCRDVDQNSPAFQYYIKCNSEHELLQKFINIWTTNYPDIVTGWNVRFFDIPYIINRMEKILGHDVAVKFSPWNFYYSKKITTKFGKEQITYVISGIATLDYIELYRKFVLKPRETYKLDYISYVELGEKKTDYKEYKTLHRLYLDNFTKFIEYNLNDIILVEKLENKLHLLELAMILAYQSKTNFEDVFMQTRMWKMLIINFVHELGIRIPISKDEIDADQYEGAYVKEPLPGMYHWIVSFDLTSEYPSLIIQSNISPEMIINPDQYTDIHKRILSQNVSIDTLLEQKIILDDLKSINCSITPNGQFFDTTEQGFLAKIIDKMFNNRDKYKKMMIQYEKEYEKTKKPELLDLISRYDILQQAMKVCLNSGYGALGSRFFVLYDVRLAEAITNGGQLSIRWIQKSINSLLNKILKTNNVDYVIASDTDSIYVSFDDIVNKLYLPKHPNATKQEIVKYLDQLCEVHIKQFIDKEYDKLAEYTNAYTNRMIMKREIIADKGIWTGKKRYALNVWNSENVQYDKPKIKIKGLEAIKSSTPEPCRKKITECIELIFSTDEKTVIQFIEKFRQEFSQLNPIDISFPRSVNDFQSYSDSDRIFKKGTPQHVRGVLIFNHALKQNGLETTYESIKEGSKIKYVHLKVPNPYMSDIIAFNDVLPEEFGLHKYIDYSMQFEKSFLDPLKLILDAIGWKTEEKNTLF